MGEIAFERAWIRTAEFCEQVRDLRRRGNSYRMIREKLIRSNPDLANKKISDEVLRAAIVEGPIDFFSKQSGKRPAQDRACAV